MRSRSSTITLQAVSPDSDAADPDHPKVAMTPAILFCDFVCRPGASFAFSGVLFTIAMNLGSQVRSTKIFVGPMYMTGTGSVSRRWPRTLHTRSVLPICVPITPQTRL